MVNMVIAQCLQYFPSQNTLLAFSESYHIFVYFNHIFSILQWFNDITPNSDTIQVRLFQQNFAHDSRIVPHNVSLIFIEPYRLFLGDSYLGRPLHDLALPQALLALISREFSEDSDG